MRRIARALVVTAGAVAILVIAETAFRAWAWRSRNQRALRFVKRLNKYVENPLQLRFSGRSGLVATVHHVGRRSEKRYATPVMAYRSDDGVVIPLPYGTDVDWLRNVLSAGQAVVDLDGRSLGCGAPDVVDIADVIDTLSASMVRVVRFNGARDAVRLRVEDLPTSLSA
jgi:deazaflavin-dependent oxidoreductase (nitroreductase family)